MLLAFHKHFTSIFLIFFTDATQQPQAQAHFLDLDLDLAFGLFGLLGQGLFGFWTL
jgi:hypothetical protein